MEPTAQCMPPYNHFSAPNAYTLGTFSTYYHKFQKISRWLLQHGKIHTNKEQRLFQQGIPTSLWAKIARQLEILKPTHYSKDPYGVKDIYEAGNWHLNGTDTSLGIPCAKEILLVTIQPHIANNTVVTNSYIKKEDMEATISTAITRNPGNIATGTLSGNANPDIDQHVQQQLIHEVLHLDSVGDKGGLSKKSRIAALEMELNTLKNQVFDGVEVPRPKQPLKGYKPMATVANDPALPAPEAPSAPTSTVPANNTPTVANAPNPLLPLHPYSGLNNHYQPPAQQNFGTLDRTDGAY
ncbi:hypothetical protein C0993_011687 [Termitomyces sp. T159_Od127]|nr:hypothetical protein C0993_011687 [Termitomyces sp. T159_Od127]